MTHPNPKVVEAVTTALIERLKADPSVFVRVVGDGDYEVDGDVNLPQLVADMVSIGQTPVDRVLAARKTRDAVKLPDREELAFELFNADNWRQTREQNRVDFNGPACPRGHAYVMADVAIAAFKAANS